MTDGITGNPRTKLTTTSARTREALILTGERLFAQHTGFAPKHYARVARFQCALDLKLMAPDRSWLSIAHELHYHDQMHLVHDFRKIAGRSPAQVIASLGDSRPQAPPADRA